MRSGVSFYSILTETGIEKYEKYILTQENLWYWPAGDFFMCREMIFCQRLQKDTFSDKAYF